MFDVETRKSLTDSIFLFLDKSLSTLTDDRIVKGNIMYYAHNLLIGFMLIFLTYGWIGPIYFIMIALYLSLFLLHFYFNGCICIRVERRFYGIPDWKGMWCVLFEVLENIGLTMTNALENNVYIAVSVCMSAIIVMRLILHGM